MSEGLYRLLDECLSDDPYKWSKLSSEIQFRRLQLFLLREILQEVRQKKEPTQAA